MDLPIFMDYNSTTPVDQQVFEAMVPFFSKHFGNPSSRQHRFGWIAAEAVENARTNIAKLIGAEPREIIFTSGATESNNLAIKGIAEAWKHKGNHIVTVQTEHKSILDVCKRLSKSGYQITYLPVDEMGLVHIDQIRNVLTKNTILVSVMFANNEIGTIQDIKEIGKLCHERNIFFHTDASQAIGQLPINVRTHNIDLMSISGHKIYGPKGIGALFIRSVDPKVKLSMQIDGGGHERGFRSGTLNVPGIVGLAKALELCINLMGKESERLSNLRDKLIKSFITQLDEVYLNGHPTKRLPNNANISFIHVDAITLLMSMKNIALSTGSACSTTDAEPSHVLKAINLSKDRIYSAIRFSLGRYTTEEEVDYVIDTVIEKVRNLREQSPLSRYVVKKNELN